MPAWLSQVRLCSATRVARHTAALLVYVAAGSHLQSEQ
jgi:hypothetical protein